MWLTAGRTWDGCVPAFPKVVSSGFSEQSLCVFPEQFEDHVCQV